MELIGTINMSNYVNAFAIPFAENVCEEFGKQTGIRLLFDPPSPGSRENTTDIRFHDSTWEFEETMQFSDEFIVNQGSAADVGAGILVRKWNAQNKSS